MEIDIESALDTREVEEHLDRLLRGGNNLRAAFTKSRRALRADQKDHAQHEQGERGRWPALAPSTIEKRMQRSGAQGKRWSKSRHRIGPLKLRGGKMLGRLPGAFKIDVGPDFIRARSRVPWSYAHWKGATAGHHARLPERDFMWLSKRFLAAVVRVIEDHFRISWSRIGS